SVHHPGVVVVNLAGGRLRGLEVFPQAFLTGRRLARAGGAGGLDARVGCGANGKAAKARGEAEWFGDALLEERIERRAAFLGEVLTEEDEAHVGVDRRLSGRLVEG